MTNEQYYDLVTAAYKYDDMREYVVNNLHTQIPENDLVTIWTAAHRDINDIAKALGMSVRQLGLRHAIPERTRTSWGWGDRKPTPFILMLIQEAEGLLKIERTPGKKAHVKK